MIEMAASNSRWRAAMAFSFSADRLSAGAAFSVVLGGIVSRNLARDSRFLRESQWRPDAAARRTKSAWKFWKTGFVPSAARQTANITQTFRLIPRRPERSFLFLRPCLREDRLLQPRHNERQSPAPSKPPPS